jgi:hypothetical protein
MERFEPTPNDAHTCDICGHGEFAHHTDAAGRSDMGRYAALLGLDAETMRRWLHDPKMREKIDSARDMARDAAKRTESFARENRNALLIGTAAVLIGVGIFLALRGREAELDIMMDE